MTAPAYVAPGAVLAGRYEILAEIGRGGYSIVYRARDRALDCAVALKLLVPPPASARVARERLRREVQAVRGLAHAHIVGVHDFLDDGAWSFVVMDLVEGPDLGIRLRDRGPLPPGAVARIGAEIADALAAAHRSGILHRDVKPQNILLDPNGKARLTDFGAARLEGQATMTQTGGLVGTLAYLAPEVMAGGRADARADVYALGMTLYFALTGQLPHRASPHLPPDAEPEGHAPRRVRPELPDWLDAVVARATRAEPARRYPSAAGMAEALRAESATAIEPARRPPTLDFCLVCGSAAAAGLTRCPDCSGVPAGRPDTLVFVDPPPVIGGLTAAIDALASMAATVPHAADLAAAARGSRALVRTAGGTADQVLARFRERGVPVRAVRRGHAWSAVPPTLYGLAGSIGIVGMYAGTSSAALWTGTPLVVGVLLLAAHRVVQRPVFAARVRRPSLPPTVDRKVSDTLGRLPAGPARSLLLDLVRLADGVPDAYGTTELLDRAADGAADLQRLDDALSLIERRREASDGAPGPWTDSMSTLEKSRDRLIQRLLDAVTLLGRLQAGAADGGGEALEAMGRDLALRAEAMEEVEKLVTSDK
ncbi:MAG TPA: serine/threonine-protein kinase [Gemmatimonadales bacterium]|nr:serine/threonine-protein kinase [Gemmatimonadales bacterium]